MYVGRNLHLKNFPNFEQAKGFKALLVELFFVIECNRNEVFL